MSRNDRSLGIQTYGESNDFPQRVMKIVGASGTGKSCVEVYKKFIRGGGMNDENLGRKKVNRDAQTLTEVVKLAASDYAMFGGFALHVNYNADYRITELQHVPFEHLRFEKTDEHTATPQRLAEHADWGREFTQIRKFKKEDIVFYNFFDPRPETVAAEVEIAGGWAHYRGQILYFSNAGNRTYPVPIFEPVLTDMRSEEAISNVVNRNVANNFLTAGAIIDKNNSDQSEEEMAATQQSIEQFQGDMKACSLMYMQVTSDAEKPEVVPLRGTNFDKEFSVTQSYVPDYIGRTFNQPPILRAVDVGASFGADLMRNAYNYYNTQTTDERDTLAECISKIFEHWYEDLETRDFTIRMLAFSAGRTLLARVGADNVSKIYDIVKDGQLSNQERREFLQIGYGLTEEELDKILPA